MTYQISGYQANAPDIPLAQMEYNLSIADTTWENSQKTRSALTAILPVFSTMVAIASFPLNPIISVATTLLTLGSLYALSTSQATTNPIYNDTQKIPGFSDKGISYQMTVSTTLSSILGAAIGSYIQLINEGKNTIFSQTSIIFSALLLPCLGVLNYIIRKNGREHMKRISIQMNQNQVSFD